MIYVPLSHLRSKESQCIYITYSTDSGKVTRYTHYMSSVNKYQWVYLVKTVCISCILLTDDTQCIYLVNLRHCTHLIGVQKSVKSADFSLILWFISLLLYRTARKLQLWVDWFYFANIITKEAWLTLINTSSFVNNGKYQTFVDLAILNPTITVILMAKFIHTIAAYLVPYIREGYDN